jgi:beta-fructofuranosidase
MSIFYRPDDGVLADVIPFYWQGAYHLFYLKDYRDEAGHGQGTPWFHLVTRDFVSFEEWGEAIPRGPQGSQDLWVFTGCAIEREGRFQILYTGHNGNFHGTGKPVQAVLRATSDDLRTWTKDTRFSFFAPAGYEPDDWRDPFVFWNEDAGEYWMLLAARQQEGPSSRRGCVALAASADLERWEVRPPFWAPDLYYTHECPDLFRMGDWWYLVYSTFSERHITHYRMSRSLLGPWLCPADDAFDGRAYYAAKSAGDGNRRFLFGWLPTRRGERDDAPWEWGGNLVVHELRQRPDGTLAVRLPEAVQAAFGRALPLSFRPLLGEWKAPDLNEEQAPDATPGAFRARAQSRFSALSLGPLPRESMVEATLTLAPGTAAAGLLLRAEGKLDGGYAVRVEPSRQRLVIDRWPRPGDQPFMLERPLALAPGKPVRLRALIDDTCLVVYADDETALSCRMYEPRGSELGLFVAEGETRFDEVALRVRG